MTTSLDIKNIQEICEKSEVRIPIDIRKNKKLAKDFLGLIISNNIKINNNAIYTLASWVGIDIGAYRKEDEYSEVKAISPIGKNKTFDLHIKNGNSYVANGIICHNTLNLPEETTVETIAEIYEMAWKMGLKGITVYRKNSRDGVMVDNNSCSERKEDKIQKHDAPKRPKILPCDVHHVSVKGEGYLVLVGILSDEPYEVFALKNGQIPKSIKNGQITKVSRGGYKFTVGDEYEIPNIVEAGGQLEEAITRLVSMGLRHGADIEFIVNQLEKTNTADFGSFEKAIGRSLKKYIKDGTKVSGESCEICGNEIVRENGCKICKSCGASKCG